MKNNITKTIADGKISVTRKIGWRVEEIADSLGVSKNFVRAEIRRGKLKAKNLGRCVIVLDFDLHAYLQNNYQDI